jgi:hypothetical protein
VASISREANSADPVQASPSRRPTRPATIPLVERMLAAAFEPWHTLVLRQRGVLQHFCFAGAYAFSRTIA